MLAEPDIGLGLWTGRCWPPATVKGTLGAVSCTAARFCRVLQGLAEMLLSRLAAASWLLWPYCNMLGCL
jgi:hypothetical protein